MKNVKELWIECATTIATENSHRFIPVHEICQKMSPTFCKILPSVHSLTGCDSTSYFLGISKKSVSKSLTTIGLESVEKLSLMDGQYKKEVQTVAREFVALLYNPSNKERSSTSALTSCAVNWHCENATLLESFLPVKMPSTRCKTGHVADKNMDVITHRMS